MRTQRCIHPIVATLLALATIIAPNAPILQAQDGASVWLPIVRQGGEATAALPANEILFRTTFALARPTQRARLEQLQVTILAEQEAQVTAVVDYAQLQALVRLGYQPRQTVALHALVAAGATQKAWLARSLQPLLAQAEVVRNSLTTAFAAGEKGVQAAAALVALRSALNTLSPEQRAGLNSLPTLDFDGDGLTDTEESWWCTDPQNPNSDGDAQGYSDGQEVAALLDVTQPRTVRWGNYGPPFGPPAAWPDFNNNDGDPATPACNDGDWDTIPDFAEVNMVGTRVPTESTDGDKFDDGQELFGITYCPGAPTNCGHGSYPRIEYWNFIKDRMPNWVLPPGDSPLVAAFPKPEIYVEPNSWTVERVTTITTSEGEMTQQTHSYETAVTRGQSTSIANTVTWNEWEEVSEAVERPLSASNSRGLPLIPVIWTGVRVFGPRFALGVAKQGIKKCISSTACRDLVIGTAANVAGNLISDALSGNDSKEHLPTNAVYGPDITNNVSSSAEANASVTLNQNFDFSGVTNALDGVQYAINQQGALLSRGLQDVAYAISQPRLTETRTNGKSWGGAQTTTHEEYEEHTISEGQAFTSGKNWTTAWAVDSSHAADLTFRYTVQNSGTEYAKELSGLIFNIYIGDDKLPAISYPAWEQFPNGKLENLFPVGPNTPSGVGSSKTFASTAIPLSLEQMKRIDLGERLAVKVENYSYGADELFYEDAVNGGVTVFIEDGVEDGDESVDTYVIPTWGVESVQDVLTRYFPHSEDGEGNLNALWTPEFAGSNPPIWHEHYLSDIGWWNVYLTQADDGNTPLKDLPARAGAGLLFRFNRDSDRDGYNDRAEYRYYCALPAGHLDRPHCADAHLRPEIHPQPELLAGYVTERTGNVVTVKLALENTGTFDAYGIDAVIYSPDGTTTIGNNTIGGNGRVRAGRQVAVGSLIGTPSLRNWGNSRAQPYVAGQFSGSADRTFTFTSQTPGVVGSGSTAVRWHDGAGQEGVLDLGGNYHAPLPLEVAHGVQVGFNTGTIDAGASFTVAALTPRDTFTYTIQQEPFTPPVIVVSYSDPQGSHRFVTPVQLPDLASSLVPYAGQMLKGTQIEIVGADRWQRDGANSVNLVVNNPHPATIVGGHLHLNFVSDGKLVLEQSHTLDIPAGPTVFPASWSAADFDADYNPEGDNLLIAFWTDSENNIIDSAARPLATLAADPRPVATTDATAWDFGTVTQGAVLQKRFSVASTGALDLKTYLSAAPGVTIAQPGSQVLGISDVRTYVATLDTRTVAVGPYAQTITLRTNDPVQPLYTLNVTGQIEAVVGDAAVNPVVDRPLDVEVWVPGMHDRGEWIQFTHTLAPNPDQIHPVKVFAKDNRLLGMGEYAISFADNTARLGAYGTGVDGDIEINTDVTFDPSRTPLVQSVQVGQATIELANAAGFDVGEEILLFQVQGEGAGIYEFARIYAKTSNQLTLYRGLSNTFTQGGAAKVQVIQVPNYRNVKITSTGRWRVPAWNGNDGGVIVFRTAENLIIEAGGFIDGIGRGFRGTGHGPVYRHQTGVQGEGYSGNGSQSWSANGNGGGGGQGSQDGGGGGGGGHATAGANGVTGQPNSRSGGSGGQSVGAPDLRQWFFGGAGGEGGADEDGGNPGGGGNGGGIIALFAKSIVVNGSIYSNGTSGGNGCQGCGGSGSGMAGGGGGAGGTIFMQGFSIALNNPVLQVDGGGGGYGYDRGGHGGGGSTGRIHAEYCGTLTGTIAPTIDRTEISCAIAYQHTALSPSGTKLALPEHFANGQSYRIQYGHKLDFAAAGGLTTLLRVPTGNWTAASLDALVSGVGVGDVTFKVDVGNDGVWDWEATRTVNGADSFTNAQLAAAFAPYVTGSEPVNVPIKVYLSKPGQVLLTNLVIARNQTVDLTPTITMDGPVTEGATTQLQATIQNNGIAEAGPHTVAFYATRQTQTTYIGSVFVPTVPAGATTPVTYDWHTLGFTGSVTVTATVDPFNRLTEDNETNNNATGHLTIRTRPDLTVAAIMLGNEEPLAGEPVPITVDFANRGETAAASHTVALYQGNPAASGQLVEMEPLTQMAAQGVQRVTFTWTPPAPGRYRLYLRSDDNGQIDEDNEANNAQWREVAVGQPSPLALDSGGNAEMLYTAAQGYGVIDMGAPDSSGNCGTAPHQTFRQDPSGQVGYRFDHLLPGHFYHLDLTLYECGQNAGRQQRVLVDGVEVAGPIDLGNGEIHRLSLLLDPALYADRTISVTVGVDGTGGALVNEIALVDVDYRYADAGGATDPAYPSGRRAYGWLDGVAQTTWGRLPYQTLREDQQDNEVRYQFDGLQPQKAYQLHVGFYQRSGASRVQQIWIDERQVSGDLTVIAGAQSAQTIKVPSDLYSDGTIRVALRRTDGATIGAMLNELALEELTQARTVTCQAAPTPYFSYAYGPVTMNGQPAPVGTIVTAENPRGQVVGCYTVERSGEYGFLAIYGEDATSAPPIPGMREGEPVIFRVNGVMAAPTPALTWHDDKNSHAITLATGAIADQYIPLRAGWNLFSTRMEPPVALIEIALQPLTGNYCLVLGERGIYDCNVPANFRSLTEVHAGIGYYTRIEGGASVNLLLSGVEQPVDSPLPLQAGLNWVGYLPAATLPITTALQSISGQLVRVADGNGGIYEPTNPTFSTLKQMTPGRGYLIYASAATTLTYPVLQGTAAETAVTPIALTPEGGCPVVPVTPHYTAIYGALTLVDGPAPVGTVVEALTPRGELAGCFQVQTSGAYGFLTLFGADQTVADSPGFRVGDPITLRIAGQAVLLPEPFRWQDDKQTHEIAVGSLPRPWQVYLPLTSEGR
jgi:hypothetical protein